MDGRGNRIAVCCLLGAACALGAASMVPSWADTPGQPRGGDGNQAKPPPPAAQDNADADSLNDIRLTRPEVPLTSPQGREPAKTEAGPELPIPGSQVVDRRCRFREVPGAGWFLAGLLPDANSPLAARSLIVLPNDLLEAYESLSPEQRKGTFRITGEMMNYRKKTFLLLGGVTLEAFAAAEEPPAGPRPIVSLDPNGSRDPPASQSAAKDRDDLADAILRGLQEKRPGKALAGATTRPVSQGRAPSGVPVRPALSERRGHMVTDRLVRILPNAKDGWWQAVFVADNTLQEAPVRLLPCEMLEQAENAVIVAGGQAARYRVSGEVTEYKGKQYLLLRKRLVEHDMGQF
ncbi:MAG TPA: hypothetical protein VMZ50_10580 [Phycisphaerae bacterium]|nr:hypothetical protein [Phycisphaerae bacterium]